MLITQEMAANLVQEILKAERANARAADYERFLMFNGQTLDIIKGWIAREFSKPETVRELSARIVPLNLVQKIINKLAGVYIENPSRKPSDNSEEDQQLIDGYTEHMQLNQRMKEANRYFKLFKRNLAEVYADPIDGQPYVRNLPRHTYEVFSFNATTPNKPDVVAKIVRMDMDYSKAIFHLWSDESFVVVDGKGLLIPSEMQRLNNPDRVNPYGALPFIYTNESSYSVDPIQDDDLVRMSILLCVILTDLCFAQKYMSWGIVYTIGKVGDIPMNPNSVINLEYGPDAQKPEIGTIKPEVDTDKVISLVKMLLATLLSTKNLSTGTVKVDLSTADVMSGVSKVLDSAESIEDKKDQQAFFAKAEQDLWSLLSTKMVPEWRRKGLLRDDLNSEFSSAFKVQVAFQEPKVLISDSEKVDVAKKRLDAGLTTLARELAFLYPQMDKEDLAQLENEIIEEKLKKQALLNPSLEDVVLPGDEGINATGLTPTLQ